MLGLIGGSNMASVLPSDGNAQLADTPFGQTSAPLERHTIAGRDVVFLPRHGRDHATKAHRVNYRANIWALRELGCVDVVAGATVGGIDPSLQNGDFVVPDQIVDYTYSREGSFERPEIEEHFEFTRPFSTHLRQCLLRAAQAADIAIRDGGTYGCTQGPRFETAAEIKRMAGDGCTLAGMTLMPEAALARQVALGYGAFCLIVNPAAGVGEDISLDDTAEVSALQTDNLRSLLESLVVLID